MEQHENAVNSRQGLDVKTELKKAIVGQDDLLDQFIISLLAGGHVLVEGVPGLAKTLAVKALAKTVSVGFKRIQFTPDLMPSDITGTRVFNMQSREFEMKHGPIFTNFLLADEINRTPPKTQAGLLESMAEETLSIDGEILALPKPYMVFATQNPLEYEGTYPLPEALVDRFLMKILIDYPTGEEEEIVLTRHHEGTLTMSLEEAGIVPVWSCEDLMEKRKQVNRVQADPALIRYIVAIVKESREHPIIEIGASPRGSIALLQSAKACACYLGRDYIIPEDIKAMAAPVLRHRIVIRPELEIEGMKPDQVLADILAKVKVPR